MRNIKNSFIPGENTEALIFDLGGVLLNLDFSKSIDAFKNLGFENIETDLGKMLYAHPTGNRENLFHLYEKGMIGSSEFRDALRSHKGMDIPDIDIDRAWTAMLRDLHSENIELLKSFKGSFRLYLLSNTNEIHIDYLRKRAANGAAYPVLEQLFDKVYYSYEMKMRKPDREIFDHVVGDAGIKAENALFIDDSAYNIEAARNAGWQAYHHKAGENLKPV